MTVVRDIPTTNAATGIITKKHPAPRGRRTSKLVHRSKLYLILLLLMFPTLAGMLLFTYYPQWETIKYSLYKWDGQFERDFIGFRNFRNAFFADRLFWPTFQLVGILLVANLFKMVPSILTAVVLHRVKSDRWQYIYRVLFVIPMIIPGLVTLLIWKQFFDSTTGILNVTLNATGGMRILQWLDVAMPAIARTLAPAVELATRAFGSVWGMALIGFMTLSAPKKLSGFRDAWMWWVVLAFAGLAIWWPTDATSTGAGLVGALLRAAAAIGVAFAISRWKTYGNRAAFAIIAIAFIFILFGMTWTTPTKSFDNASPAWLGESKLIIPALIFWGFPWVGTVGVLIYLAGLQNISADVYEAAEIDGLNSIGKFWSIELPLILTQVRINLIFMTIGTLTDYGLIFLLLGPQGGPGNIGMVPGLYMYKTAFVDGQFGYACALGMILAALILVITVMYQKYVKVDK
jgi:ABC-type sugar transport system permease subunit